MIMRCIACPVNSIFLAADPSKAGWADHGRTGPLTFLLTKNAGAPERWLIQDIDIEAMAKAGRDLEAFLKKHSDARLVRLEKDTGTD